MLVSEMLSKYVGGRNMKDARLLPIPVDKKLIGLVITAVVATSAIAYYGISSALQV